MAILPMILHYHRRDLTENLCAQVPRAVVVDAMGDYDGPNRRVVVENHGFAANWNRGLEAVWDEPWDHVALMNNDIILESPGLFEAMEPQLDADPEIGIASACFNSPWQSCNCNGSDSIVVTGGVEFTAPVIRRDVLSRIGLFDEAITTGFGVDAYYCHYARRLGYKIVVDHRVSFHHLGNRTGEVIYGSCRRWVEIGEQEKYQHAFGKITEARRSQVIQRFAGLRHSRTYLEVGYGDGNNFQQITIPLKHSVDPYIHGLPDVTPATSDDFFEAAIASGDRYDMIFIDGNHTYEQVLRDYQNALRCLNRDGLILFHDVNPLHPDHVRPFERFCLEGGVWTGDAYRAWAEIRRDCQSWTGTVLDDLGMGIVDTSRPGSPSGIEPPTSFAEFEASRRRYLNPILYEEIQ